MRCERIQHFRGQLAGRTESTQTTEELSRGKDQGSVCCGHEPLRPPASRGQWPEVCVPPHSTSVNRHGAGGSLQGVSHGREAGCAGERARFSQTVWLLLRLPGPHLSHCDPQQGPRLCITRARQPAAVTLPRGQRVAPEHWRRLPVSLRGRHCPRRPHPFRGPWEAGWGSRLREQRPPGWLSSNTPGATLCQVKSSLWAQEHKLCRSAGACLSRVAEGQSRPAGAKASLHLHNLPSRDLRELSAG